MGVALDIWKKKEFDKGFAEGYKRGFARGLAEGYKRGFERSVAEGRRLEREAQRRRDSNHAPATNDHEHTNTKER